MESTIFRLYKVYGLFNKSIARKIKVRGSWVCDLKVSWKTCHQFQCMDLTILMKIKGTLTLGKHQMMEVYEHSWDPGVASSGSLA